MAGGIDNVTDTSIATLAIGHLSITEEIQDLTTDKSKAASSCRRFINLIKDKCLRDFPWGFATKYATLSLVESTPNSEWAYSYRYPSDCVYLRKILSGIRNDTRQSKVPYILSSDDIGKLIFCDLNPAEVKYTKDITDPSFYTPDYILMCSYLLAGMIAPGLTRGDGVKLGDRALALYESEKTNAWALSENEQQTEEEPESEFIRERE